VIPVHPAPDFPFSDHALAPDHRYRMVVEDKNGDRWYGDYPTKRAARDTIRRERQLGQIKSYAIHDGWRR
jgi:hypothetical protein